MYEKVRKNNTLQTLKINTAQQEVTDISSTITIL